MQQVHPEPQFSEKPSGDDQPEQPRYVEKESKTPARPGTLDIAIDKLRVPLVPEEYNGTAQIFWEGFNKGVNYGATTILVGIRSAQELSSLGIAQATPIIKMAQEMRQAEGQAAQEMAAQLAQSNMQSSHQILGAINNLAASQPNAPNPMAQIFAETMKPLLQQVLQSVMGGVLGGFQRGQTPSGQEQGIPAQTQPSQEPLQSVPGQTAGQPGTQDNWGALPENVAPIDEEEDIDV